MRFNTQPRGGGCGYLVLILIVVTQFQHTAARRRLPHPQFWSVDTIGFQHTAARRRLPVLDVYAKLAEKVSTHSRAEAAA